MSDVNATIETLAKEWSQFRSENDRRLAEIEKVGKANPLTDAKIDKHSEAIGALEAKIKELAEKAARPPVTPETPVQTHAKAFGQFLRKGVEDGLADLQVKAMSLGANADGGYAVPQDLDRSIYEQQQKFSPMRGLATVITVSNEKYEQLVNIHGAGSGWVAEGDARSATNTPKFAQFKPIFGEMYALATASQRAIDDVMFNLEGHITSEIGKAFGILENVEFTSGSGVAGTSPKGFLAYTPSASPTFGTNINLVKSGTSATIVADKLLDVESSILAAYRPGSVWMGQAATFAAVRKLKDSQNRYLWEPSLQAGVPANLLGYATATNEDMPAIGASANALVFGNFKAALVIADVVGTRVLRDPFTSKPNVLFYATKRVASGVRDTSALTAYQLAA